MEQSLLLHSRFFAYRPPGGASASAPAFALASAPALAPASAPASPPAGTSTHTSSALWSVAHVMRLASSQGSPTSATVSSQSTLLVAISIWQPLGPRHDDAAASDVPVHTSIVSPSVEHAYEPRRSHGSPDAPADVSQRTLRASAASCAGCAAAASLARASLDPGASPTVHARGPRQCLQRAKRPSRHTRAVAWSSLHA